MAGHVVVKFGGSLVGSTERAGMLAVAARACAVVVPGGGGFADGVRDAQTRIGFSDAAAHAMAILAMDQTALLLNDAEPSLPLCATPEDFASARVWGHGAIWRPSPMALGADMPASWDVTSDSLAIWLAIELAAPRVVLLKSAAAESGESLDSLAARGVVDAYGPIVGRRYAGEVLAIGPATAAALAEALASPNRQAA